MKKIMILAVLILIISCTAKQQIAENPIKEELKTFSNYGFSMKYPDWTTNFGDAKKQGYFLQSVKGSSSITVVPLGKLTKPLQETFSSVKKIYSQLQSYELIEEGRTIVNNKEAYYVVVKFLNPQAKKMVQIKQTAIKIPNSSGGDGYIISYNSPEEDYDKYILIIDQSINSFKVVE